MKIKFKKLLCYSLLACSTIVCCSNLSLSQAEPYTIITESDEIRKNQNYIEKIGYRLLNANRIDRRVNFVFSNKNIINANSNSINRKITFYKGIANILKTEDEVAGVLAHEISHAMDSYNYNMFSYLFTTATAPRKYEYRADVRAVDYMVKAGYDPLGMIIALNRILDESRIWTILCTHPRGSLRLMHIYEYIYNKYPYFLVNSPYKNDPLYQNFLLTSRKQRIKLQKKIMEKNEALKDETNEETL